MNKNIEWSIAEFTAYKSVLQECMKLRWWIIFQFIDIYNLQ